MLKGFPGSVENSKEKDLRNRLVMEYRHPSPPQTDASLRESPLLVFRRSKPFNRIHLTVVWDAPDWVALDFASRCKIAMHAFGEVYPELAVEVSSSLGTTTDEAASLGIDVDEILEKGPDLKPEDLVKK
jgi:hypothetical protein